LIFANGSRLAGDLSSETIMVSTGAGLVEVAPDEVVTLSREEIRLRDGRVIRGTLVGGQLKAQTTLGEIAVKVDELQAYRGAPQSGSAGAAPAQTQAPQPAATTASPVAGAPPAATSGGPFSAGLPTMAAYQEGQGARPGNETAQGSIHQPAVLTREAPSTAPGASSRVLEVLSESGVYRDALFSSSEVGRVAAGQQVRYVDSIDRRLRILNLLVFDGGYWIKVRLATGTEGWVPADHVREVR
jgi:hypothetical protein